MNINKLYTFVLFTIMSFFIIAGEKVISLASIHSDVLPRYQELALEIQQLVAQEELDMYAVNNKLLKGEQLARTHLNYLKVLWENEECSYVDYATHYIEAIDNLAMLYSRAGYKDTAADLVKRNIRLAKDTWLEIDMLESYARIVTDLETQIETYNQILVHTEFVNVPDPIVVTWHISRIAYHARSYYESGDLENAKLFYHQFYDQMIDSGLTRSLMATGNHHWDTFMSILSENEKTSIANYENWREALSNGEALRHNFYETNISIRDYYETFRDTFAQNFEEVSFELGTTELPLQN